MASKEASEELKGPLKVPCSTVFDIHAPAGGAATEARISVLRRHYIHELTEYLQDTASREDLQLLLTKDENWDALVEEAELSRNEEAVLRKALKELVEDKINLQREVQEKKRFLEAFPWLEREFVGIIRKLYALADHTDEVHKGCILSNVVIDAASTASGFLRILGLALAPMTVGGSLVLSGGGFGLGAMAAVTGAASVAVEEKIRQSNEAEARRLISYAMNIVDQVITKDLVIPRLYRGTYNIIKNLETFRQHIRAIRMARANPQLVADDRILMTNGNISAKHATRVHSVFKSIALKMTKKARIRGIAVSGVFLALDMYNLVQDWVHLHDGVKSESAETLRKLAQQLEEKLRALEQIHRSLQLDSMTHFPKQQQQR